MIHKKPFATLGIPDNPVILAPLAGVSDHPFRRACYDNGADLAYVEMISATALIHESRRTLDMLKRHESESICGVQITGRNPEETAAAIEILHKMPFDTIDINMGCPVRKVVKTGCGSAILKDPDRVFRTLKLARQATNKPLSAKIRIGWDRTCVNSLEVADAIEQGGADWMVVHGRTRSDDYSVSVDLDEIARVKEKSSIPVIGNGNIFSHFDAAYMRRLTKVDGVMVSRGALGNPWIFNSIKKGDTPLLVSEWVTGVRLHLERQQREYGDQGMGAIAMRKHLLWYAKGWPGAKVLREKINSASSVSGAMDLFDEFAGQVTAKARDTSGDETEKRFQWEPKWEMDRKLDRGVGDDGLADAPIVESGV